MNIRIWLPATLLFLLSACKPVEKQFSCQAVYVNLENQEEDEELNKIIAPYKTKIDAEMNTVIGISELAMPKVKDVPESLLGNFVADIVLQYARRADPDTKFSVLNNGGLRTSLPAGEVTVRNIYELMPFDNEIVILTLSGREVEELVSYVAAKGGVPVAGITMEIEKINGKMVPGQVNVAGVPVSKDSTYKVATSDYLANGGDQMDFWVDAPRTSTLKKIRDAIIEFIRLQTGENKKVVSQLDGRISLKQP